MKTTTHFVLLPFRSDHKKVLRDATNVTPFKLVGKDGGEILVAEPLASEQIMDDLTTTFDRFEPNKSTVLERGIDRIFGDVSKGFQETERMLNIGISLFGIGKLVIDGDTVKIVPPDGGNMYILTKLTKPEVVTVLRGRVKVMKVLTVIFGVLGMGMFMFWAYKKFMHYKEQWEMDRALAEYSAMRSQAATSGDNEGAQNCVICLSEPKEVVVLDCGHICMCARCAGALPEPRRCPMCRQNVVRIIPVYVS